MDGKEWDRVQKKWVRYDLNEEATRVLAQEWEDEEQERQRGRDNHTRLPRFFVDSALAGTCVRCCYLACVAAMAWSDWTARVIETGPWYASRA